MARKVRLITAWVLALASSGCVSANDAVPGPAGTDFAGQTVEVAATWSGVEEDNFKAVLDAFSRQTHATVAYTSGGNDLPVLLNSRLAGGAPPDIAMIPQPGVVGQLQRRGVLKVLTDPAGAAVRRNYSNAWQNLGTIDGKLYGFYFKVANKSVVWYRTEAFDDAGVAPPRTWDDFTAISRTLVESGATPIVAAGGDGWVLTDWFENAYLRIGGPDNYDKLARHELRWTDPTVVRTLARLAEYWRTPKVIEGGTDGALQVTFTQAIADVFGEKPKSAMLFEGDFVASEITKLQKYTLASAIH